MFLWLCLKVRKGSILFGHLFYFVWRLTLPAKFWSGGLIPYRDRAGLPQLDIPDYIKQVKSSKNVVSVVQREVACEMLLL